MPPTRPLDFDEMRVLGALMEKEQTTPDHYPMTIDALIAACNQKTNREPVTRMSETQVVEALDRLRLDVLTWRSEGARVERWEHRLERRWHLTPPKKALMTLLLLRGAQTVGELKARSERMHGFESAAEVEATLRSMRVEEAGAENGLVRELGKRPGQREARWIHLMAAEGAMPVDEAPTHHAAAQRPAAPAAAEPRVVHGPSAIDRIDSLEARVDDLETLVAGLDEGLVELRDALRALRVRLGDLDD